MNKKIVWLVVLLFLAPGKFAEAQQTGKVARIRFLDSSTASGMAVLLEAFREELSKLGWVEGKNITIEYRFAEQKSERLPELRPAALALKLKLEEIDTQADAK